MELESSCIVDFSNADDLPKTNRPATPTITVPAVYDVAASIGKDFEAIIDHYGSDSVSNLMPKVISILEELENFATRFNSENRELVLLQAAVHRLEAERVERMNDRHRNEKEMKQIEEMWTSESGELKQLIENLQADNMQLKMAILDRRNGKKEIVNMQECVDAVVKGTHLMMRLKEVISKQKVELGNLQWQLTQKNIELDAMEQQAVRLAKINAVWRRRHLVGKRQTDQLLKERHDLEEMIRTKERLIEELQCSRALRVSPGCQINTLWTPAARCGMTVSLIQELNSPDTSREQHQLSDSQFIERLNEENKMFRDSRAETSDLNRQQAAASTIDKLRELFTQRNELKSRLIEVEEELSVYAKAGDNDSPVQGPINREPSDKLGEPYPMQSRMKSFFESLFGLKR